MLFEWSGCGTHLNILRQWEVDIEHLIDVLSEQLKLRVQCLQSCTSILAEILDSEKQEPDHAGKQVEQEEP